MSRRRKDTAAARRARADRDRARARRRVVCEGCQLKQPWTPPNGDDVTPCRCGHLYARNA